MEKPQDSVSISEDAVRCAGRHEQVDHGGGEGVLDKYAAKHFYAA